MKRRLGLILLILLSLLLAWAGSSWVLAKNSMQYFDDAIAALAVGHMKNIAEIEVLSDVKTLLGRSVTLKIIPATTMIDTNLESRTFILKQFNGPILVSTEGVQLGVARWELTEAESTTNQSAVSENGFFSKVKPIALLVVGFFEKASLQLEIPNLSLANLTLNNVVLEGDIDIKSYQHQFILKASELIYSSLYFAVRCPKVSLVSAGLAVSNADPSSAEEALTKFSLEAEGGELVLSDESKKIPLNLQSHGSIWANNDTLSSDWQVSAVSGQWLKVNSEGASGADGFKTDITFQFRDLLTSGFGRYLQNQSDMFSLLQQAEWAVEEVETPEQQYFLRSLLHDAERIRRSQLDNPLKPLLIAERSQLAVNATFATDGGGASSQLLLNGNAMTKIKGTELVLEGLVKVARGTLSNRWLALLSKWSKRRWFRHYEAEFESDIAVRNEQLRLNNFIVSVDSLSNELTQALIDQ